MALILRRLLMAASVAIAANLIPGVTISSFFSALFVALFIVYSI